MSAGGVNIDAVGAEWRRRGFSCEIWIDPPGQCWEDFVHATDELVMVLSGEVEFEIAGEIVHPEAGVELTIPAGDQALGPQLRQRHGTVALRLSPVAFFVREGCA